MNAIKFVEGSENLIEGLGMPFGGPFNGRDLDQEFFSVKTDFALDWFKEDARPLLYNHGLDADSGASVVGRIKSYETKADMGVWTQAQLDASSEYFGAIKELVRQGKLYFSSGAMSHLVDVDRKSGEIKRWPWVELSLTPTPANLFAQLDFATAEKHFKSAGLELPDAVKAPLKMSMPMMRQMVKEMDMEMSDEEMQAMIDKSPDMTAAEARAMLQKRKGKSATLKTVSWEDIRQEISRMCEQRMGMNPFAPAGYCYVEETYSDHAIVEMHSMMGDTRYFTVPFTLGPDGHVAELGECTEVEETYVPKKMDMDGMSMGKHADLTVRYAAALSERTKDLRERRIKEGRMLSGANRQRLQTCVESMGTAMDDLKALLDSTEPAPAKAAVVWRLQFALLKTQIS